MMIIMEIVMSATEEHIREFIEGQGGIASVTEGSAYLDLPTSTVRNWARDNGVRRVGSTFVFDAERLVEMADDLIGLDDDEFTANAGDDDTGDEEDEVNEEGADEIRDDVAESEEEEEDDDWEEDDDEGDEEE